jgi:hypothetical protein
VKSLPLSLSFRVSDYRDCRSTFLACDRDGPAEEILVYADAAVIVGTGLVRSLDHGQELYAIQYSHNNTTSHNNLVVDMHMGGTDPVNVALGSAVLYHMNNCCCPDEPTADTLGVMFRVMHVGSRLTTGFTVKQSAVRANVDITRAMFIEAESRLVAMGYPLPPCLDGKLRLPVEFFYGTQNNSRVPRLLDPQRVEEQRCACLTMVEHR